jgi:hypothetical protein
MNRNSQAIGAENAEKLEQWIRKTPLRKIPLNSRGMSAKRTICKLIGISPSTIGTNAAIKVLFCALDEKLLIKEARDIPEKSPELELNRSDLAYVLDELERLRASNERLRHLNNTGVCIPEE